MGKFNFGVDSGGVGVDAAGGSIRVGKREGYLEAERYLFRPGEDYTLDFSLRAGKVVKEDNNR